MHSYNQLSLVVTTAPSLRNRASAMGTSSLLQLDTASAMTYTRCPSFIRSSVVCVTHMCDSMPTTTQSSRGDFPDSSLEAIAANAVCTSETLEVVRNRRLIGGDAAPTSWRSWFYPHVLSLRRRLGYLSQVRSMSHPNVPCSVS